MNKSIVFSKKIILIILLIPFSGIITSANACTLKMGYRTNAKPPLIAKMPDNQGLYFDIYTAAAEKIGCQLEIIRQPKKRIIKALQGGTIDFYPGFNFTEKREKYTFYINNGLPGGDIGMSVDTLPEVVDLNQLKGKSLLSSLGAPDFLKGIKGVKVQQASDINMERVIKMLITGRADFYIYNKSTTEYYIKKNKVKNIKLHPNCCGGLKPLYLGFSKKSPHFKESPNANYDANQALSAENYPTIADKSSIAYKLELALKQLKTEGITDQLYNKYFR